MRFLLFVSLTAVFVFVRCYYTRTISAYSFHVSSSPYHHGAAECCMVGADDNAAAAAAAAAGDRNRGRLESVGDRTTTVFRCIDACSLPYSPLLDNVFILLILADYSERHKEHQLGLSRFKNSNYSQLYRYIIRMIWYAVARNSFHIWCLVAEKKKKTKTKNRTFKHGVRQRFPKRSLSTPARGGL